MYLHTCSKRKENFLLYYSFRCFAVIYIYINILGSILPENSRKCVLSVFEWKWPIFILIIAAINFVTEILRVPLISLFSRVTCYWHYPISHDTDVTNRESAFFHSVYDFTRVIQQAAHVTFWLHVTERWTVAFWVLALLGALSV